MNHLTGLLPNRTEKALILSIGGATEWESKTIGLKTRENRSYKAYEGTEITSAAISLSFLSYFS